MVRAGNGLRGHLLQAMVQAKQSGNLNGHRVQRVAQGLGQGVSQQDRLQELLSRIGFGGGQKQPPAPAGPNGVIHGFGPGGAVTGTGGGDAPDPITTALGGQRPGYDESGISASRPADVQHAMGNNGVAAQLWEQHHPGAVGAGHIPGWVTEALTNAVSSAQGGHTGLNPSHIQVILQHLSQAMDAGNRAASPIAPAAPTGQTYQAS